MPVRLQSVWDCRVCNVCDVCNVLCFCVYGSFSVRVMTVLSMWTEQRQKKELDDEELSAYSL